MREKIANAFCWAHYGMDIKVASRDVVQACNEFADKVLGLTIEVECPNTVFHVNVSEGIETGKCDTCDGSGKVTIPLSEALSDYPKYKAFWEQARMIDRMNFEEYEWKERGKK